ncbi:hypothetical protein [Ardenticatena maritima]|uniref:Uncharacterized protein n=1 Tax=Ardenticatena maritima TaxID=872965 RepID=A0A0P6Y348_9CHLR|nr:hypothetical protein [Ardenticatena maritima]KPL86297.1 hypothetical protein SE16_13235 [Ardenticatena maritima]
MNTTPPRTSQRARRTFVWYGVGGLVLGTLFCLLTWLLSAPTSWLAFLSPERLGSPWPTRILLFGLGLIVVSEIPMMLWVLIRMAKERQVRFLTNLTHATYTAFPGVYALMGGLLTGQRWWAWPMLFICVFRFTVSTLAVPQHLHIQTNIEA